jgi:hypothetical protein
MSKVMHREKRLNNIKLIIVIHHYFKHNKI